MSKQGTQGRDVFWPDGNPKFVANSEKMSRGLVQHKLDFRDASQIFNRPGLTKRDFKNSTKTEVRYVKYGYMDDGRAAVAAYTWRDGIRRIFSSRFAERQEERELVSHLRATRLEESRAKERRQSAKSRDATKQRNRDDKERNTWKRRDNIKRDKNKDLDRGR